MAARGRKSEASLAVVEAFPDQRPAPLPGLSKAAAEEWRAVTARMPAAWFTRETHALLAAYCDHTVSLAALRSRIDEMQAALNDETVKLYETLLRMRDREARAMTTLATKLRLTNQSRYEPAKANTAARKGSGAGEPTKLWEFTGT